MFDDILSMYCPITIILIHMLLSLWRIERWFSFVHLTHSVQLSYLGYLSNPEKQELADFSVLSGYRTVKQN